MAKKFITGLLLFIMLSTGVAYPFQVKAFLGFGDIVIDPAQIFQSVLSWADEAGRFVLDRALDIVVANLKKRLLDALVDSTVKWIQGDGDPRFVTDPGGFFEDAVQAAIGDTVQAIGLGDLCYPQQKLRLQLQLAQPVFSQRITCTLDDIVGNVSDFINDFDKGGWVAYREIIKPQNNRWGLELLAQDELFRRQSERRATAEYEASVGGSFLAQKRCLRWQQVLEPGQSGPPANATGDTYYFETPNGEKYNGKQDVPANQNPNSTIWKCVESQTITPGLTIGESVTRAIGSDIDYIVNAQDLTTYVAAIVDAMVNRLSQEATMGLLGLFTDEDGGGVRGTTETKCSDISDDKLRAACEGVEDKDEEVIDQERRALSRALSSVDTTLNNAESALLEARNINNNLINTLNSLIACQTSRGVVFDEDATTKIAEAGIRDGDINLLLGELPGLVSELDTLQTDIEAFTGVAGEKVALQTRINALTARINVFGFNILQLLNITQDLLDRAEANLNSCNGGSGSGGTAPQCSDGVDNADPEDSLIDAADPGCHTDGDAGNSGSYNPNDNDETDAVAAAVQCSDGIDNADPEDSLIDAADPGCHTDGDAGNAASYDPNDNDEADVAPGIPNVEFSIPSKTVNENVSLGYTNFEIILSFAASSAVTVDYDLLPRPDSSADLSSDCTQSPDFCLPNGLSRATVTFPAGTTSQLITIGIYNDTIDEADETVKLQLISPSGANLGSPDRFTLTIINDDGGLVGI